MSTSSPCLLRYLPLVQSLSSALHPGHRHFRISVIVAVPQAGQISSCFRLLYMLNITAFFPPLCLQKLCYSSWNKLSNIVWIFCFHGKDFDLSKLQWSSRKAWSTFLKRCSVTRTALNVAVSHKTISKTGVVTNILDFLQLHFKAFRVSFSL